MKRKMMILWLLWAAVSRYTYSTAAENLPETGRMENETEKIDTAQPEFVITERPFLSFEDMEPDEERSQVFSIRNTGAEEEAYYLTIQAPEEITWELTKAGDPYDSGRASGTPLKLGVLQPGEHMVFQLTVKNAGDTFCSAFPAFSEKKILSCGTK